MLNNQKKNKAKQIRTEQNKTKITNVCNKMTQKRGKKQTQQKEKKTNPDYFFDMTQILNKNKTKQNNVAPNKVKNTTNKRTENYFY